MKRLLEMSVVERCPLVGETNKIICTSAKSSHIDLLKENFKFIEYYLF